MSSSAATTQSVPETQPTPETQDQNAIGIRQYLTFVLGLLPVAIAIFRVVLESHGDSATFYTLVQTLNVPTLVIATYGRFIGVLGIGISLPLIFYSFEEVPKWIPRAYSIKLGPLGKTAAWTLLICSISCLYPEQIIDLSIGWSLRPTDISRAEGWAWVLFLPAWAIRMFRTRRPRWPLHWFEILIVAPSLVLLLWSYLLGNDRMWLPAQAVTVRPITREIAVEIQIANRAPNLYPGTDPQRTPNGDKAFVAYVLSQDSSEVTLLTTQGLVLQVPVSSLTRHVICQWEPDYDPRADAPLLILAQTGTWSHVPSDVEPTCGYWIRGMVRGTYPRIQKSQ